MTLYLGIDGGGTGCRAAVADASGRILGLGTAGPANIASNMAQSRDNILNATRQALDLAVGPARAVAELGQLHAGLGLAGANTVGPTALAQLDLPFARMRLETDAIAGVKGALGQEDGIVAAIGTGSVFARMTGGVVRQIGGWGMILGDEGSGAVLGRSILSCALRAHDGHADLTPLLTALLQEFGGPGGVVRFAAQATPADFAALSPRVTGSDDKAAKVVMIGAAHHVKSYILNLQDGGNLPVVFTGGLGPVYAALLADQRWPVRAASGTALDGALLLARETG